MIEKATADRPEARFLPVHTNLSKQLVGVAEKSVADLGAAPAAEKAPAAEVRK